jgi:hypothetical protein
VKTGSSAAARCRSLRANWWQAPFSRLAFHQLRELVPSAAIANDPIDVSEGPIDRVEIDCT